MSLKKMEIFQGLSSVELARLLGSMERLDFPAGSVIFEQGDEGDCMYVIMHGQIEIFAGRAGSKKHSLAVLQEGETFGEMALMTGEQRSASAEARSDVVLLKMGRDLFQQLISEQSTVSVSLSRLLCRRLALTNKKLQKSKNNYTQIVSDILENLPDDMRTVFMASALLPITPLEFLKRYFEMPDLVHRVEKLAAAYPLYFEVDSTEETLVINTFFKGVLARLYVSDTASAEVERFITAAAEYYLSKDQAAPAVELYCANGYWQQACAVIAERANEICQDNEQRAEIFTSLEKCPEDVLLGQHNVLQLLLKMYSEEDAELGLARLERILDSRGSSLTKEERATLYEYAAEFSKDLGYHQKAAEYLNMAANLSLVQNNPYLQLNISTALEALEVGNEERAFQLAKKSIESAWHASLVEKAGRLIDKNRITVVLAVLLSVFSLFYFSQAAPFSGQNREGMVFIGISLAAVFLWIVDIISNYLVALLMAMSWVLMGLVTPEKALSGFAAPIWLYMVGVLALGAAVSKSGLLYRISLLVLKSFPQTYIGQLLGLAVCGLIFTPLIPSAVARVVLASPIALSIAESMGFSHKSNGSSGLGLVSLIFFGYLTPFFMTGSATNILALGLVQDNNVSWLSWLWYALPPLFVFSICMFVAISVMYKPEAAGNSISQELLNEQLKTLGNLTREEILSSPYLSGEPWA